MQCPECQAPIEAETTGLTPPACPKCGASVNAAPTPARKSRISIVAILTTLLLVALAAISAGSTMVAMRAIKQRDAARQNFVQTAAGLDAIVAAVASNDQLKGKQLGDVKVALLQPALAYYQDFVKAHDQDPELLPQATAAQFRVAGLLARMGSKDSVPALAKVNQMLVALRTCPEDPNTFPSMKDTALKLAPPQEWISIKGASMSDVQQHGLGLFLTLQGTSANIKALGDQFPKVPKFRDDFADLSKVAAAFLTLAGRSKDAQVYWDRARTTLETLVQEQPANTEYQARLAEAAMNLAKIERSQKENAEATTHYERALQILEQLAAANPEDKSHDKDIASIRKDLEKLKSAQVAEKEAAPPPEAAPQQ